MFGLPDDAALRLAAAWLTVGAALAALMTLSLGLSSVLTGRDYWPKQLRRLRPRKPASPEDQRRYGMGLLLTGAAILIILMGSGINIFGAFDHSQGEPLNTLRFVLSVIGFAAAMLFIAAAYGIGLTVSYVDPKLPAEPPPAEPSS
jgi:uncharacterized iron-regulated membrane protein